RSSPACRRSSSGRSSRGPRSRCSRTSRPRRTTPRSTRSRGRSCTRCATARRQRSSSRCTTGRSTRPRSTSCCSPRSGAGRTIALDGEKGQVDSLCSNIGHLLWSGIVPEHRVEALVDALMGDDLWSGWGVRTMGASDAAYNPLTYHNGTVWPHDNSLIAWGLARYGFRSAALRIVRSLMAAAGALDYQLPEVFGGFQRSEAPQPIPYPPATKPQAWAAGTSIL